MSGCCCGCTSTEKEEVSIVFENVLKKSEHKHQETGA